MDITSTRRLHVQALIKDRNLSLKDFADKIERSPGQVSAIAGTSAHKGIGNNLARHIERCFDLSHGYLDHPAVDDNASRLPMEMSRRLPVLGLASAGRAIENIQDAHITEYVSAPGHVGPRSFALRIEGISMEPRFTEGDKIIIDPDLDWKNNDFVYASKVSEDTGTFKQLRIEGDEAFLCATNEHYSPRYMRIDSDWVIIGKARWRVEDL